MSNPVTIAIDAMGGYAGPKAVVEAVSELSLTDEEDIFYLLVGDERHLGELLVSTRHNPERITVVHAAGYARMAEPAKRATDRADTTIGEACRLVAEGAADAVVTAGHAGAAVLAAHDHFDPIEGIARAALATVYPTPRAEDADRFSLILDVGATVRADADDLVNFALMGAAYARTVTGKKRPTVGLLSNSREPRVGPEEVVRAHEILRDRQHGFEFAGNVEGHQIPRGDLDVVVCEGYVGDVTIKVLEGFAEVAFEIAEQAYERKFAYRMGLRLLAAGLKKIKRAVDFEEYGGAPLLGFDKVLIVADPRSGAKAISNAIKLANKNVRARLPSQIAGLSDLA
jgi:glycerol-3-phosphate acyltransferase PlsX